MHTLTIIGLSLATSVDALTASVARGSSASSPSRGEALRTGAIFGGIQAMTTLAGWWSGKWSAQYVASWTPLLSLIILCSVAALMLHTALYGNAADEPQPPQSLAQIGLTGLATSMDAIGIGASLAFADVNVAVIAASFGMVTFLVAAAGTIISAALRNRLGNFAGLAGGVLLASIGICNYVMR